MGTVVLDGRKISLKEFREVEENYKLTKGKKKLKKLKEGVYKTIVRLQG